MQTRTTPRAAATAGSPPPVRAEGLTKRYGHHLAVDSLSFEVPAGRVVGLLGPNGAGKTTAMKVLVGLVRPSSGRAAVFGAGVGSPGFGQALHRIGTLIEAPALYERLSARRNLELQARALGIAANAARFAELLELVDLSDRSGDRAGSYSLGMKQRLGIAIALVGRPELVILDEPANGLDPAGIVEIRELLRRLPSMGTSVLVSSHQLAEVQQACDSLVVLSQGRLIASGTTEDIIGGYQASAYTVRVAPSEVASTVAALAGVGLEPAAPQSRPDTQPGEVTVDLPDDWSGRDLNQALVGAGIYAIELTHDTVTLEQAFLAMTGATDTTGAPHVAR
ncbi:MAG: ATP-binding cassette domain-containing protein [Microthrixaceae bacterium]